MYTFPTECSLTGCTREPRMAIALDRRPNFKATVFFDNREATKTALHYCKTHGILTLSEVTNVLVDGDNIVGEDTHAGAHS
jgi:hypothetical protein